MDKYLTVILAFMVVGIPIAFVSPSDGNLREPPLYLLFYASIGGIIVIVLYSSYTERQERRRENARRKRPKK
ncbi:MAG: hypothetical protein D9C04_01080 [Nitrosopumilus sp. B06]|nr:MAG: hypothetical protein EB828_00960 [Nitrosopumilus sp. D6]RNJ80527.1 MAG: hypothetical protein D9C04_01080 [Nitrosopumilus sp. B06]